ncbi:MAG: GNAT family N-acetyltransferase [Bacteriovoracaceae bacterium]
MAILSDQLGYPVNADELLQRFQKLASKKRHELLVYEEKGKVLGWIHLERVEDLIEEDKVEIKALIVDENSRGKRIGQALIRSAEKWVKSYHLHTIYLNSNIIRERTRKFYEREGFKIYKQSLFFEKMV